MNSNGTKRVTLTLKSNTAKTTWFDITVGSAAPTVEESHSIADSDEIVTNYVVSLKEGTATDVLDKAAHRSRSVACLQADVISGNQCVL